MEDSSTNGRRQTIKRNRAAARAAGVQIGWLLSAVVAVLLAGLLLCCPTAPESALRIVNQELDLGEVRDGDVVKFDLLVENTSPPGRPTAFAFNVRWFVCPPRPTACPMLTIAGKKSAEPVFLTERSIALPPGGGGLVHEKT